MATNKLDRIERDIQKTKTKIAELQKQLRELEAAKTEQEDVYKRQANNSGPPADCDVLLDMTGSFFVAKTTSQSEFMEVNVWNFSIAQLILCRLS